MSVADVGEGVLPLFRSILAALLVASSAIRKRQPGFVFKRAGYVSFLPTRENCSLS
jgi:hypothetical protein